MLSIRATSFIFIGLHIRVLVIRFILCTKRIQLKNYIAFMLVFLFFRGFHLPNSLGRFLFAVLEHEVNLNKLFEIVVSTSKSRLKLGNACYHSVQNLLSSSLLFKNLKIKIYRTIILPVALYECETWSLTLREERRLRVFEESIWV